MGTISAKSVKSLRDRTGAGMMDCKKALQEVGGDEEQAIDLLRKWGAAKAARRSERATSEGLVHVEEQDGRYAMVAVSSETDFVARNDEFRDFGERLARHVLASGDVPDGETIEGEALLERGGFEGFGEEIVDLRARIGENITVERAVRLEPRDDSSVASYVHFGGKIGVLVELAGGSGHEAAAREVAMHVAAADPIGVSPDDIPSEERERERRLLSEQAKDEGKPESIVEKIVEGRMRKFYEQNALLLQPFVKDPDTTIQALLNSAAEGLTVRRFVRFQIGD
jgi:elongation factor Ts